MTCSQHDLIKSENESLKVRNQELENQVKDLAWQIRNTRNTAINAGNGPVENANELLKASVRGLTRRVARLEGELHALRAGQESS